MEDINMINNTLGKFALHLKTHNSIVVSVSGGSDSDILIHIIATYFREYLNKIHFVFINTGLEYKATRDHIENLKIKYNINIETIRGMPIPLVIKKYGLPIISKDHSQKIAGFCNGSEWATSRVLGTSGNKKYAFTKRQKAMAIEIKERGIKISDMCCKKSKKNPFYKYMKDLKADLSITGERQCEGGIRASSHKTCFEEGTHHGYDKFMPLFFWSDETKEYYKKTEGIVYSACYEVWGMKRTGCVGCPFNSKLKEDLELIAKYEPNMYKACLNIFGESYRLMDKFEIRKHKIFDT